MAAGAVVLRDDFVIDNPGVADQDRVYIDFRDDNLESVVHAVLGDATRCETIAKNARTFGSQFDIRTMWARAETSLDSEWDSLIEAAKCRAAQPAASTWEHRTLATSEHTNGDP